MIEFVFDSSDRDQVADARNAISALQGGGSYRVRISQHRRNRTVEQNSLYWVGYVHVFGEWFRDHGNDHITDFMAHEILRAMFLKTSVMNPATGEVMDFTRSTTELDVQEFSEYLEKIGAFFGNDCGIEKFGSNRIAGRKKASC